MKILKILPLLLIFLATSCVSVRVSSDYDKNADFKQYKTFAFYKKGIDKVDISDLDKRRILRAIEADLLAKGFTKSENPDLLVNIFTKSREKINVYNNNYHGWYPYYMVGMVITADTAIMGLDMEPIIMFLNLQKAPYLLI